MKGFLRVGSYRTLNVYFVEKLGKHWGACVLPTRGADLGTLPFILDGCTVVLASMPGGRWSLPGHSITHEVGHWLGLLHTFEGHGCHGSGDHVDDTPRQRKSSSRDCLEGRDSCPRQPGLDPIHNYMDYSSDFCKTEFTSGQAVRMHHAWKKYREHYIGWAGPTQRQEPIDLN
jgi:hypothetical protein